MIYLCDRCSRKGSEIDHISEVTVCWDGNRQTLDLCQPCRASFNEGMKDLIETFQEFKHLPPTKE